MSESPAEPDRPGDAPRTAAGADAPNGENTQVTDAETTASRTSGSGEATASEGAEPASAQSLTFRILPISLLTVLVIAVCATPLAFAQPLLLSLYLIPILLAAWVLRARTVVTREKITVYAVRRVELDWDDVRQFRLNERRWLRAVVESGREVLLPAVRVRDLPNIAAMSGGRIPDPTATSAPAPESGSSTEDAAAE